MSDSTGKNTNHKILKNKKWNYLPQLSNLHQNINQLTSNNIWRCLLIFRCINACLVQTFFQPDEFYQSLEPAWQMTFGTESGSWITWEWEQGLRSSLHPLMFAIVYFLADSFMKLLACSPQIRATILTTLPNLAQAYFASLGDFYTWELSKKIYSSSNTAWVALMMSVLSPWQWFFSTRTFSNSLEMSLTIVALNFWPWAFTSNTSRHQSYSDTPEEIDDVLDTSIILDIESIKKFRICLLLAGTACILRPTNLLIWFSLIVPQVNVLLTRNPRLLLCKTNAVFLIEGILCLTLLLIVSAISDRLYYHTWIFPPYRWLHFNIVQDLATFYGANEWHFYFTQGLPQLLFTYFPFTLVGIWNASVMPPNDIRFVLTATIMVTIGSLSLISHKEVRFIYPILPLLFIVTAPIVAKFFTRNSMTRKNVRSNSQNRSLKHKFLLITFILLNVVVAIYITTVHQSGVIAIISHIRKNYENSLLTDDSTSLVPNLLDNKITPYVAFLMPCHSTPFRSALIYPNLTAWALTCSPPLHIPPYTAGRLNYRDEADRFYDAPAEFLRREVGRKEGREWPLFVVGFKSIEDVLGQVWESMDEKGGNKLKEKKRIFNSHWHDDPRRKGDVIFWELIRGSEK